MESIQAAAVPKVMLMNALSPNEYHVDLAVVSIVD